MPLDPLDRFAEQTELKKLYDQYSEAYETLNENMVSWPEFNDFRMLKSIDGAGVYYTPETTLFGNDEQRLNDGAIAKSIGHRILECASYFLAQNIPVDDVPDTIRICLSVCHHNIHWTGVVATLDSFKTTYKKLYDYCRDEKITFSCDDGEYTETQLHNRAKNAIYNKLGIILEHPLPGQKITPEIEKIIRMLTFFQQKPMLVEHYDSMNSDYYHKRIEQSLDVIESLINLQSHPCALQQGNTCGDHTTVNLFAVGMMRTIPAINAKDDQITSTVLRELTDSLEDADNLDGAKHILKSISSDKLFDSADNVDKKLHSLANEMYDLINRLHTIDPQTTTKLVHQAVFRTRTHDNTTPLLIDSSEEQTEVFTHLEDIFTGKSNLYNKLNIDKADITPYGLYFTLIAADYCVEIEHQNITTSKTSSELEQQRKGLDFYALLNAHVETILKEYQSKLKSTASGILQRHIAAINVFKTDKENIAPKHPEITLEQVRGILLLHQFKYENSLKAHEIKNRFEQSQYLNNLKLFYTKSVEIWLSDENDTTKCLKLQEEASNRFKHQHSGMRLFADAMIIIGCLFIGLGAIVGFYRLSQGKTFLFSGNSSIKKLNNEVIEGIITGDNNAPTSRH